MGLAILILLIIIIIIADKKLYNTFYSPSLILGVPFTVICILYAINAENLGFIPLNYDVLYIWVFGMFFFWVTGVLTKVIVPVKRFAPISIEKRGEILGYAVKLSNLTLLLALLLTYTLYKSYFLYISYGGDAVEEFLGRGIQAHLLIQLKFLSIFSFISLFGKGNIFFKLKGIYSIFIAVGLSILYGTKSGMLILVISYFFLWVFIFNKRIKVIHVGIAIILGFGVFYISYSLVFGLLPPPEAIWNHMIMYYVSGTAGMNGYFSAYNPVGLEPDIIIRPISNVMAILTGNSNDVKVAFSDVWTKIGSNYTINVRTFFGTLYMYGGAVPAIISIVFFSFICHIIFIFGLLKSNLIYLCLYTFILSILCFGWFDFYFNSVAFYETIFLAVFLKILLMQKVKRV